MKIYNYHHQTKEYMGESNASVDPLESKNQDKSIFLIPANATKIKPRGCAKNEVAIFPDNKWVIKKDYRGIWFDKTTKERVIIDEIGIDNTNLTKLEPAEFDKWDGNKWTEDTVLKAEYEKVVLKETLIAEKTRDMAIDKLMADGILDANGNIK